MIKNMGLIDKIIRVVVVIVLALLGLQTGYWILYLIALIMLVTIFIGFCPLYKPIKIDTRSNKEKNK